jgi:hypothetical protein
MKPIPSHRQGVRSHSERLRRARRLYVFICKKAIEDDPTSATINRVARRYMDSGMFASPSMSTARASILKKMCRIDGCRQHWHRWILANGWVFYTFERSPAWTGFKAA